MFDEVLLIDGITPAEAAECKEAIDDACDVDPSVWCVDPAQTWCWRANRIADSTDSVPPLTNITRVSEGGSQYRRSRSTESMLREEILDTNLEVLLA